MKRNLLTEIGFVGWITGISFATAVISSLYGPHFGGFIGTGAFGLLTVWMIGYYTRIPRVK